MTDQEPKNFKVVHVTTVDISLAHLLLGQMEYLKRQGYVVESISAPGEFVDRIVQAGIPHHGVPLTRKLFSPIRDIYALRLLVKTLRVGHFNLAHVHTPKASFLGQIAAHLAGTPVIIRTLHGFYFHSRTQPSIRKAMIFLEKIAARYSDVILSQNREDIQTAVQEGICPPEKIRFLGNGIPLEVFSPQNVDRQQVNLFRTEFNLDPEKKVIGFVGRLVAEKGLPELLRAIQLLRRERDDFYLLVVGPIDQEKSDAFSTDLADNMGVAENCRFVGYQERMPELYSLMDMIILPSHREGFPRSLMEASAMGVPGISTDIRGCREVIRDGENGLLVPVKSPRALADAMKCLLNDPILARAMGERGRQIAREKFDERQVFLKVFEVYREFLTDDRPGSF